MRLGTLTSRRALFALVLAFLLSGALRLREVALFLLVSTVAHVGLLGRSYPGIFEPGDTEGLTRLLHRAETEPDFLGRLRRHVGRLQPLFAPAREKRGWRTLLRELS